MNTKRGENGCVEGLDGAEEASNPPAAETELPPAKRSVNVTNVAHPEVVTQVINSGLVRPLGVAKRSKYYSEKATEYALTPSTCPHCGAVGRGPVMRRHHHNRCKQRPQP